MTFFYNLNKKLANLAKPTEQLNERKMREGSIQGGVWTATPPKSGQPNVPVPQNPDMGSIKSKPAPAPAQPGSGIRVDGKPLPAPTKEGAPMTSKQKKFAKLAPPADKITFADKIAGAKKEVDEMLGDVAATAIKKAVRGKQQVEGDFGPMEEGWDDMMKDVERRRTARKVGDISHGAKHDTEEIPGGRRVTRRTDPNTGYSVGADDDKPADGEKRGRGRPKGTGKSMGAKGPSGKSKLMKKEGFDISTPSGTFSTNTGTMTPPPMPESKDDGIKAAMSLLKKAGYKVTKADAKEPVEEKAVSKKQQKFMGMVHAAQQGEKPASPEVAKVAKTMKKKDAEDFASTKHKGLPEKKKPEGKKKEKTEEAGGTSTPTASSGFSYGKGIYDSINRELEEMIAESLNVSMNSNSDGANGPSKSLTVTATDEDASYLAQILKSAGLGGGHSDSGCGCGETPCSCGSDAEHVDENKPDWPTNDETSHDAFQYSGGLNKPKSTGQTTTPVIAHQDSRMGVDGDDELRRIREMAGIAEAKKVDEDDVEEGNKFTGNLAKARAAGKTEADLDGDGDKEKVKESILDMKHLWSEYKG